jgi:hypothetical protein
MLTATAHAAPVLLLLLLSCCCCCPLKQAVLTDPVLAGEREVVGGATTALTLTCCLEAPAHGLPAEHQQQRSP